MMLRRLRPRSIYDVMAAVACFVALAGGVAYADNEFTGANIKDGSLTGADVFDNTLSSADVTDGSLTGTDVKDASLTGADVLDNTLSGADVTNGSLTGTDVRDHSLSVADVAEGEFNFGVFIGVVPAHGCVEKGIGGLRATRDHLLLTPNNDSAAPQLTYGIEYLNGDQSAGEAIVKACNPTDAAVDDGTTRMNLLVFAA
jgi:hypothetical protein